MVNISYHQRNANRKNNEILPHTSWYGHYSKTNKKNPAITTTPPLPHPKEKKTQKLTGVTKDAAKLEFSWTMSRSGKGCTCYGKSLILPQKA